eukprot:1158607-Pelagomonas_calceolata.AAC.2
MHTHVFIFFTCCTLLDALRIRIDEVGGREREWEKDGSAVEFRCELKERHGCSSSLNEILQEVVYEIVVASVAVPDNFNGWMLLSSLWSYTTTCLPPDVMGVTLLIHSAKDWRRCLMFHQRSPKRGSNWLKAETTGMPIVPCLPPRPQRLSIQYPCDPFRWGKMG